MSEAEGNGNIPLTRDQLRAGLIGKKHEPKTKLVELFGMQVELRQPNLESIVNAREITNERLRTIQMIIDYTCVPGTTEKIFEEADVDTIMQWPMSQDLANIQIALAELTGIDISDAEQEIKQDPLSD